MLLRAGGGVIEDSRRVLGVVWGEEHSTDDQHMHAPSGMVDAQGRGKLEGSPRRRRRTGARRLDERADGQWLTARIRSVALQSRSVGCCARASGGWDPAFRSTADRHHQCFPLWQPSGILCFRRFWISTRLLSGDGEEPWSVLFSACTCWM